MNIAFFTESNFTGKINRDNNNSRTEIAWYISLDAFHCPINQIHNINEKFDLGIVIIPKKNIEQISQYPIIENMRKVCNKIAFMQEGPFWYFQDWSVEHQIWFYNILMNVDIIYCHNRSDEKYFRGITDKDCRILQSLMITDNIKISSEKSNSIMIGGNCCSWYGAFDSYIVANQSELPVFAPSMGRRIPNEEKLGINHLPYMNWSEWISELSKHKIGIHLMRTFAAGTFALNCSFLGIPCIGYKGLDTQEILHPQLSVEMGDVEYARELLQKLTSDEFFYKECSEETKKLYERRYSEKVFLEKFYNGFK